MASQNTTQFELGSQTLQSSTFSIRPHRNGSIDSVEANDTTEIHERFSLPPADGGKDAWLFLLSCFMLEALIWGFPATYGIFQAYYSTHEPFAGSSNIAVVGACAMGIMYMDITIGFILLKWFPRLRAWATPVGLLLISLALGLGSLATNVTHLILTQGVLYAIGGGLAWTPILFFIEEWWVRRRGFAYGVTMAGLGMSGAILPIVLEKLLNAYGFRVTLRICAIAFAVATFPVLVFFKPRVPLSQATRSRNFDLSFWKCSNYLILQSSNIMQSLGAFMPAIYLPTFARSLGASNVESIVTVVLLNAAAFVGSLCMGAAVDKYQVTSCLLVAAIGSATSVFLFWGLSSSLPLLYVFCIAYGAFAGCSSSTWSAVIRDTVEKRREADSGMVFSFLSAGKGLGSIVSGPLSEVLLQAGSWKASEAYGSGYGPIIVFTGITGLLGGWGIVAKRLGWL